MREWQSTEHVVAYLEHVSSASPYGHARFLEAMEFTSADEDPFNKLLDVHAQPEWLVPSDSSTPIATGSGASWRCLLEERIDVMQTTWDAGFVSDETRKLVERETLPDANRSDSMAELAHQVALAPHDLPSDDDLVTYADGLFAELDRREQPE